MLMHAFGFSTYQYILLNNVEIKVTLCVIYGPGRRGNNTLEMIVCTDRL